MLRFRFATSPSPSRMVYTTRHLDEIFHRQPSIQPRAAACKCKISQSFKETTRCVPLGENDLILAAIEDHPILPRERKRWRHDKEQRRAVQHGCRDIDVEKQLRSGSHAPDLAILFTRDWKGRGEKPIRGPCLWEARREMDVVPRHLKSKTKHIANSRVVHSPATMGTPSRGPAS